MTPLLYITLAFAHVSIGVCWGFLRWSNFFNEELAYYEQERQRFLIVNRIRGDEIPDHLRFEWRAQVQNNQRLRETPPQINAYKGEITFDVFLWPVSMVYVVLQSLFEVITHKLLSGYNLITSRRIERIQKDLK